MLLAFLRQIWQVAFGWSRGAIVSGACGGGMGTMSPVDAEALRRRYCAIQDDPMESTISAVEATYRQGLLSTRLSTCNPRGVT